MDPELLEAAITPRTRAVIPVHLNGRLCRMDQVMEVARKHSLLVVEDTAQALGASYQGVRGGQWGVAGAFSFYPAKLLGAYGDAGAVVTDDPVLAQRIHELRDHGRVTKAEVSGWGHNCRMDNLQAALLDVKLTHVPQWIERRRHLAGIYDEALAGVRGVKRPPAPASEAYFDVYQNYVIEATDRDGLKSHLDARGIETLISWPIPNHHQPIGLSHLKLPRTEELSGKVISLPLHTELEDDEALQVAAAAREYYS
jgi:dTDP-4-amino-4,6-dideoxygalactose transaminase